MTLEAILQEVGQFRDRQRPTCDPWRLTEGDYGGRSAASELDFGEGHSSCIPGGPVLLNPRQQQIADLLLQGCENAEIAKVLKMNRRTLKAHFNRLFRRFGISDGIKRVKLATLLYRRQLILEANAAGRTLLGSILLPADSRPAREIYESLSTPSRRVSQTRL